MLIWRDRKVKLLWIDWRVLLWVRLAVCVCNDDCCVMAGDASRDYCCVDLIFRAATSRDNPWYINHCTRIAFGQSKLKTIFCNIPHRACCCKNAVSILSSLSLSFHQRHVCAKIVHSESSQQIDDLYARAD